MLQDSPVTADMPSHNLRMLAAMILDQVQRSRDNAVKEQDKPKAKFQQANGSRPGVYHFHEDAIEPFELLDLLYPDQCSEEGLERMLKDMDNPEKERLLKMSKTFTERKMVPLDD